ncbi:hypothetical protein GEMRC1_007313 [Eukaryota sp. GEM-RC1]
MTSKPNVLNSKALKQTLDQHIVSYVKSNHKYTVINKHTDLIIFFSFIAVVAGAISRWFPVDPAKDRLLKIVCLLVYICCVSVIRIVVYHQGRNAIIKAKEQEPFTVSSFMKKYDKMYKLVISNKKKALEDTFSVESVFFEDGDLDKTKVEERFKKMYKQFKQDKQ